MESINIEISKLKASVPEEERIDKEGLTEVKNKEVFASSLLVISISLLALIVSGLVMGIGDLGEAFTTMLVAIICTVIAAFLLANDNPWGFFLLLAAPFGLWQAILLSPFLLVLVPAMFIVPWLIISGKKSVEDKFESTLADEQRAIDENNKAKHSGWEKELADLKKKADDKRSNLKSK